MNIEEIKLLYEYNSWADARLLAACARVEMRRMRGDGGARLAGAVHRLRGFLCCDIAQDPQNPGVGFVIDEPGRRRVGRTQVGLGQQGDYRLGEYADWYLLHLLLLPH